MTSPFGQSFASGTKNETDTVNDMGNTTTTTLQEEFYNHALSMAMRPSAPPRESDGAAAGGSGVWPPGSVTTVASGVVVTQARALDTGSMPSAPVSAWPVDPAASYPRATAFVQAQVGSIEQHQHQQSQSIWYGNPGVGPLPSLAPPGTPAGVLGQGNGVLCQPQASLPQQQQSTPGFSMIPATSSAPIVNPLLTFPSLGNGHAHSLFTDLNGATTGAGVGSIFASAPGALANGGGTSNGVMGSTCTTRNHGSAMGMEGLVPGTPSQILVGQPQHSTMFPTAATGNSVFTPAGVAGGDVHPAAAAAAVAAIAAAAGGAGANTSSVPFPSQSFLQLNPLYPGLRRLLESPPVYAVDDFFTHAECDALITLAGDYMMVSPVVGAGAGEVSESRTSSSCFLAREDLPTVCSKVMSLTGKPIEHLELPQVGRYYTTQKYANHWDAFDLATEDGRRFAQNGGQRVCTVLVYLNDVGVGGCTNFPRLGLRVQPKKGMAVVFFPATLDGTLDPLLLHAAEPAVDIKWVSQIWIRQSNYNGTPTARIPRI